MPTRGLQSLNTPVTPTNPKGFLGRIAAGVQSAGEQAAQEADPTNPFASLDRTSDTYAADAQAAISRADYNRYKQRYQPLEDLLLSRVGNQTYNQDQINKSVTNFNQGFGSSVDGYQRNLQRYGLSLTPDETTSFNRMVDQSKTLGNVEAINRTSRDLQDQEYSIIGAGTKPQTYNREG